MECARRGAKALAKDLQEVTSGITDFTAAHEVLGYWKNGRQRTPGVRRLGDLAYLREDLDEIVPPKAPSKQDQIDALTAELEAMKADLHLQQAHRNHTEAAESPKVTGGPPTHRPAKPRASVTGKPPKAELEGVPFGLQVVWRVGLERFTLGSLRSPP